MTTKRQRRERNNLIRLERVEGEPAEVEFNPAAHPGLVKRLAMGGLERDQIAAVIGIRTGTLRAWERQSAEVAQHLRAGQVIAGAEVVQSLFDQAVGWVDEKTGRRRGTNVVAGIFLAKNWLGYANEPAAIRPPDDSDKPKDGENMTPEQVAGVARALMKKAADAGDGPVIDLDAEDAEFSDFNE